MTKVLQHKVTCSSCGEEYPAMVWYSTNTFGGFPKPEELQEAQEKSGICPKCGTKNEVSADLPKWEESPKKEA